MLVGSAANASAAPASTTQAVVGAESAPNAFEVVELRKALEQVVVYWRPVRAQPRRGRIKEGTVFAVGEQVQGRGCSEGWARVRGGGFVCLDDTEPTDGRITRVAAPRPGGVVPYLYAKRANDPAFSYAFTRVVHDDDGERRLVRPGGTQLDASRFELHRPSRFSGRDLEEHPLGEGLIPAFTYVADAPVYPMPTTAVEPVGHLSKHTYLEVDADSLDADGHWYSIPDALGPGRPGYVDDRTTIRRWTPAEPPEGVADDEIWIDIDLDQQMLSVRRGADLVYVTLISSGIRTRRTPTGIYRIRDKRAQSSMASRPTSADAYLVEKVPWTMYFRDYYAIHGAYWHDVFGQRRSHGCVNLAPRDAAYIYSVVGPRHEPSFHFTYASDKDPGSVVRIRRGNPSWLRDFRDPPAE